MASMIDKTVTSKYQPKSTNVIWVDTSQNPPVEKHFVNGKWKSMGGGVSDYSDIKNKPTINGVELDGNKTTEELGINATPMIEVTYNELKELRDNSELIPGTWYRITDYACTTTQDNTQSAEHAFDVIVRADDASHLNENAYAAHHTGDTYFANCSLEAWELKYCLDNDTNRFSWADDENGKGVIFYMKDEWGNIAPFDFKNMLFTRDSEWFGDHETWAGDVLGEVPETDLNFYFLSWVTEDGEVQDVSIVGQTLLNDEGLYTGVYGNEIKEATAYNMSMTEAVTSAAFALPCTIIVSSYAYESGLFYGCYSNKFGDNCSNNSFGNDFSRNSFGNNCSRNSFGNCCQYNLFGNDCGDNSFGDSFKNNTFGNYCQYNQFGSDCYNNLFGNDCGDNSFGSNCVDNSFGNHCYSNTFGAYCKFNIFGNDFTDNTLQSNCYKNLFGNDCINNQFDIYCQFNSFGNEFYQNSFGNYCQYNQFGNTSQINTFGNNFRSNTLGNDCGHNTFGNGCQFNLFGSSCTYNSFVDSCSFNTFGNHCYNNSFGNYCQNITVFDGVQNCIVTGGSQSAQVKNAQILNGTAGTVQNKLTITFDANKDYTQVAANTTAGVLKIYNPADLVP